jgi:hypothetical protein
MKTIWLRRWLRLHKSFRSIGVTRILLTLLIPVLIGILMRRNDYSLSEDLYRLMAATAFAVAWWYLIAQKRRPHA